MVTLSLQCPKCDSSENVRKNGHSTSGHQRYQCTDCRHTFQADYSMKGSEPGMHEKIVAMAMNGSGCRETSRVLGIRLNMVLRHLKKLNPLNRASVIDEKNTIIISAVMDEQWSFVGAKKKLRWLFYAYDRVKRKVLCYVFGRRIKATLNRLLTLLGHASICYFMTDAWPVYSSFLAAEKHIIGKRWTQRIERHNRNLRTHIKRLNRKTICFSKSPEMHDKVIGWYLTIHHYQ